MTADEALTRATNLLLEVRRSVEEASTAIKAGDDRLVDARLAEQVRLQEELSLIVAQLRAAGSDLAAEHREAIGAIIAVRDKQLQFLRRRRATIAQKLAGKSDLQGRTRWRDRTTAPSLIEESR